MLLAIAIVLVILWALGVFVARVASGLIHLIIIIAILVFAAHLVRGRGMGWHRHAIQSERHW